jgi:hypothetical protein
LITKRTLVFEVDRARFSAPAAAEKTHLYREEDNNQKEPLAQMMDPVPGPGICVMDLICDRMKRTT